MNYLTVTRKDLIGLFLGESESSDGFLVNHIIF